MNLHELKEKITPLPWEITQDAPQNPKARFQVGHRLPDGFATYVFTIKTERNIIRDGNERVNVAYLCHCANHFAEVVEALKVAHIQAVRLSEIVRSIQRGKFNPNETTLVFFEDEAMKGIKMASAALAAAEEVKGTV